MRSAEGRLGVVIVDSNRLLRESLAVALPVVSKVVVQATADDRVEGLFLTKVHRPRLLVIGDSTTGVSLELLCGMVTQASPTTRILLACDAESTGPTDVRTLGSVWGTIDAAGTLETYSQTLITTAFARRRPSSRSRHLIEHPLKRGARGPLSAREMEVLELISVGSSNSDIAEELYISAGTVKRHVANIYSKLDVNSRVEALRAGVALGLVQVPQSGTR